MTNDNSKAKPKYDKIILVTGGATKILTSETSTKLKATLVSCERSELENKKYSGGILS